MSLEAQGSANPTGVNPFNGLSDDSRAASHFENLWDAGAFNPDGKPDPEQGQSASPNSAPASATPEANPAKGAPTGVATQEQGTETTGDEGPDYVNVEDYLQKTGIERDSFLSLPIRVKVDGKEMDVPLSDVVKNYGLERHFQSKSIAFAEQQQKWEAERTQAAQALQQRLQGAEQLNTLARQQLLSEYQTIDWNKLRVEDPLRWSVLNTEFNQKASQLDQHLAQIQQHQQAQAQQAQQEQAARLPKERDAMLTARPEWRDEKQFSAARSEISTYAQKLGFSAAELGSIFDHRYMLVLHDAARFAALQAKSPEAVKRVRAAPQQANPGARIQRDPKQAVLQQAKDRWKKNPRDQSAAEAVFDQFA